MTLRLYHTGVSSMKNMFNKKAEEHQHAQQENPFSDQFQSELVLSRRPSKDDDDYGKPLPGSKSEARAMAAQAHVMMEIKYLVEMIWDIAEWRAPDGRAAVTFGKLFNLYIAISDKVVGTLLRARKHGYIDFDGEMLYQRRDDDKIIELKVSYNTIRKRWGMPPVDKGGEVQAFECDDDDIKRRNSCGPRPPPNLSQPRRNSVPCMALNSQEGLMNSKKVIPAEVIVTDHSTTHTEDDFTTEGECSSHALGVRSPIKGRSRSNTPAPTMNTISEDETEQIGEQK